MAAGPQRAARPAAHVTAHVAPAERALLERARMLDAEAHEPEPEPTIGSAVKMLLAQEFRALAEELHYW